jgi:hypothetical protein
MANPAFDNWIAKISGPCKARQRAAEKRATRATAIA